MGPRGFTNPAPKTESARSALSAFTCTLCNKSYSRHPEYEAHISSYDHQHRKRLQDLKQLSRDPNAAVKARRAERKADAEAGLKVLDAPAGGLATTGGNKSGSGGGFKKGGFKSSFATVKGPAAPVKKNVLGDDDDDENEGSTAAKDPPSSTSLSKPGRDEATRDNVDSDTEEEDARNREGGGYYDPHRPTGCFAGCAGMERMKAAT
ncbi:hypothetical protein N7462_001467 [Penicillium macrosclerotiorum]|uniref:uncharacterized protein n=1 Tax=Penicillium macrosclerotiorum TaxID=303699 RepID=UPI00254731B9|nr:uncharacterized protein N7462_001467 [Penicillium macrosclerotiorum]KAJ5692044.1 hypothetical protein N7462_001467 [Penicillium macrosclerotiorum]